MEPDDVDRLLSGESGEIVARLKDHLAAEPDDAHAWLQLGIAYSAIEHWGLALSALQRAVDLDEEDVDARMWLARILARLRRPDKAAFQLVQAKRLAPDDARVARQLGVVFYDKGLLDKAQAELERATVLDPTDGHSRYALGLTHEAKRNMAEAIACYREAVRLAPTLLEAKKTLADALAQMGEIDGAIAELRQLLQLERNNPQTAINLEVLEQRRAETEAARLIGKPEAAVAESALVKRGSLLRRTVGDAVAYTGPLCELRVGSEGGVVTELTLSLKPAAATTAGDLFGVNVVAQSGETTQADYATAASLTLLREALGCSLTQASELYARLLRHGERIEAFGAHIDFGAVDGVPGLRIRRAP